MIPKWKLAREFDRLKTKAHAIPLAIIEPFAQRRYDARRDLDLRISKGAQAAGKALAIFMFINLVASQNPFSKPALIWSKTDFHLWSLATLR